VTALVAACRALGISRIGLISPYVPEVSDRLCRILAEDGIETPLFGSFNIAEEEKVTRISAASVIDAAQALAAKGGIEALFLSCTNLRTLGLIDKVEAKTGLPVMSSNTVLTWHLARLAGLQPTGPGRLAASG
jgi:maleate isomerase